MGDDEDDDEDDGEAALSAVQRAHRVCFALILLEKMNLKRFILSNHKLNISLNEGLNLNRVTLFNIYMRSLDFYIINMINNYLHNLVIAL